LLSKENETEVELDEEENSNQLLERVEEIQTTKNDAIDMMEAQDIVQQQEYTETVKDIDNLQDIENSQKEADVGRNEPEDCEFPGYMKRFLDG